MKSSFAQPFLTSHPVAVLSDRPLWRRACASLGAIALLTPTGVLAIGAPAASPVSGRVAPANLATLSRPSYSGFNGTGLGSTDPEDSEATQAVCRPPELAMPALLNGVARQAIDVATWVEAPETGLETMMQSLGPKLAATFSATPWPDLHEQARLAKVPVMMYHDILPEKEVFFDVTPEEFESHLQLIQENGLTPITMDQLVTHLRTGLGLPEKPILLTFDDGYVGHYEHVYPLLKKYGYPGLFSIYTYKVGRDHGRPGVNWEQLRTMAADPLVTIAAHSVNHPRDLRELTDAELWQEVVESKHILETELGIPIRYFTYPEGNYDERVAEAVAEAGYRAALTMDNAEDRFAGESQSLLAVDRMGQSQLQRAVEETWGGPPSPRWGNSFDFTAPVRKTHPVFEDLPLTLVTGGQPVTIHADSRYQVEEIIADTEVVAAVDGGFFSMKYLDSNVMIGPVLSQHTQEFVPGNPGENLKLNGRPLVLISPDEVRFVPFDAAKHNSLEGVRAEMPDVTDAFVGAAWLVKNSQPRSPASFGDLFDFDAARHRAFWGINQSGQPVIGITNDMIGSVGLGQILQQAGFRDAVMLDSGASTSLAYRGEPMTLYTPRPVPHVVGLVPTATETQAAGLDCAIASETPSLSSN
ncbi:MAG: polysaccharide deacetylase family protein [Synechococcales bacterium]|nr:polysaccharide deacetylase family protein [Synechococcales bacterium]